jgi:hypothetical protein
VRTTGRTRARPGSRWTVRAGSTADARPTPGTPVIARARSWATALADDARGRPAARLGVLLLIALSLAACGDATSEPCSQADLDQPGPPIGVVPAVAIKQTRHLNGDRLEPLPLSIEPGVNAEEARRLLARARPSTGGGSDELLLGLFSGKGYPRVPAWVLFTSHLAQRLAPIAIAPGVKTQANANICVYVDVVTALNALTGQIFYTTTATSAGS